MKEVKQGDVVLFNGKEGHAALVIDTEDTIIDTEPYITRAHTLLIEEWNWTPCTRGIRRLSVFDPALKGIYRPFSTPYHFPAL